MVHISRIDLNLFVVFDAIYSEGGVTRASERLHLTQPAISHALGRLRELLGDPLFVRRGKGLIPTPLARNIIGPVRSTLRTLETAVNRAADFAPGESGKRFVVGLRDIVESSVLPALMRQLAEEAPMIDVTSARVSRRELQAELEAGSVDAVLDVFLPLPSEIRSHRIGRNSLVLVGRRQHPGLRKGCDLATYLKLQHVLVTSRRRGFGAEDLQLRRLGLERRVRLRCQHYFAACRAVEQTDLVLTMPERYARVLARHFEIRIHPLPLEQPEFDLYLYWHVTVDDDPANRWLRRQILKTFEAEPE